MQTSDNEEDHMAAIRKEAREAMTRLGTDDIVALVGPGTHIFKTRAAVVAYVTDRVMLAILTNAAPAGRIRVFITDGTNRTEARTVAYDAAES